MCPPGQRIDAKIGIPTYHEHVHSWPSHHQQPATWHNSHFYRRKKGSTCLAYVRVSLGCILRIAIAGLALLSLTVTDSQPEVQQSQLVIPSQCIYARHENRHMIFSSVMGITARNRSLADSTNGTAVRQHCTSVTYQMS